MLLLVKIDVSVTDEVLSRFFDTSGLVLGVLLLTAGDNKLPDGGRREVKRTLWAGIATDMLDTGIVFFGLAAGKSSRASAVTVSGGAVASIIVGAVGMRGH